MFELSSCKVLVQYFSMHLVDIFTYSNNFVNFSDTRLLLFLAFIMLRKVNKSAGASQPNLQPATGAASSLHGRTSPQTGTSNTTPVDVDKSTKSELLSELCKEISSMFKKDAALWENLSSIKSEIQTLKAELS